MKDVRFIWGLPQEDSFIKLKELVTSASILVLPDDNLPSRLKANGSGIATRAILSQQSRNDNAWHPITFLSKVLNPVERNYEIYDTKMLAIIRGLENRDITLKVLPTLLRSGRTTKILNTFELPRNSINIRPDGHFTCRDLTIHFTISQVEV
jgi:hypothetical protein